MIMSDTNYTEDEINWAIGELKKKHPERANREQAISYLDTVRSFIKIPLEKIAEDKKSGKLKSSDKKKLVN